LLFVVLSLKKKCPAFVFCDESKAKKNLFYATKLRSKIGRLPKKLFSQAKLFSPACLPAVSTKE